MKINDETNKETNQVAQKFWQNCSNGTVQPTPPHSLLIVGDLLIGWFVCRPVNCPHSGVTWSLLLSLRHPGCQWINRLLGPIWTLWHTEGIVPYIRLCIQSGQLTGDSLFVARIYLLFFSAKCLAGPTKINFTTPASGRHSRSKKKLRGQIFWLGILCRGIGLKCQTNI